MLKDGRRLLRRLKRGLAAPDPERRRLARDLERRVEARTAAAQAELRASNQALVTLARELEERVAQRTEEVQREKEAAVRATEAKSLFLANMSHEIRTPLHVLLGFCHLAAHTCPLSSQQRKYLGQIQTAAHTLMRLVNDNLDLSKIEAGVFTIARAPVRLGPLCQELIQLVRQKAEEKGLCLRIEWDADVPAVIRGDADRLLQVLLNLVSNALKFTEHGKVRLCLAMERGGLQVRVRDTGMGLDAEQRANLFTPFTQFHDPRDGSGLGLALSRRLVDLMGGRLTVEGAHGKGSTFGFTLPVETLPALPGNGPTALVVEPLPVLRRSFAAVLRPFVHAFQAVATLDEAEHLLAALRTAGAPYPDLIFLPHGAPRLQRRHGVPARSLIYRVRPGEARLAHMALKQGWINDFLVVPADSVRLLDLMMDGRKPASPTPRFLGSPRLLLVEDSAVNRMMTRELLERTGIQVEEAEDGRQALQALTAPGRPFDAILMDLELPDMSGLEVSARLRASGETEIPIIALTGHLLQAERCQSVEAGMNGFLAKPLEPDLLYRTLQDLLPTAPSPPPSPSPSLDWTALQSRVLGNQELAQRVLAQFRRELKSHRNGMRAAMAQGDLAALVAQAHNLAGAAANLGAQPVHLAALRLQQSPSGPNLRILEQTCQGLEDELAALEPAPSAPAPTASEVDLARLDALLARNSLEACGDLRALVDRLRDQGREDHAVALRTALEGLDFTRARRLLSLSGLEGAP